MTISTLHDLMIHELKDLYSAEEQIAKALPKMIKQAKSTELADALELHLKQTEKHIERLDEIGTKLDVMLSGHACKGMQGIIEEGEKILAMEIDSPLGDIAMIAAAQRVEHYEIAGYGTAFAYAQAMEHEEVADLLEETLNEEEETDEILTSLSEKLQEDAPMMDEGN